VWAGNEIMRYLTTEYVDGAPAAAGNARSIPVPAASTSTGGSSPRQTAIST
jgi:hypothetical protein